MDFDEAKNELSETETATGIFGTFNRTNDIS